MGGRFGKCKGSAERHARGQQEYRSGAGLWALRNAFHTLFDPSFAVRDGGRAADQVARPACRHEADQGAPISEAFFFAQRADCRFVACLLAVASAEERHDPYKRVEPVHGQQDHAHHGPEGILVAEVRVLMRQDMPQPYRVVRNRLRKIDARLPMKHIQAGGGQPGRDINRQAFSGDAKIFTRRRKAFGKPPVDQKTPYGDRRHAREPQEKQQKLPVDGGGRLHGGRSVKGVNMSGLEVVQQGPHRVGRPAHRCARQVNDAQAAFGHQLQSLLHRYRDAQPQGRQQPQPIPQPGGNTCAERGAQRKHGQNQ